jgi:hypothetical protein
LKSIKMKSHFLNFFPNIVGFGNSRCDVRSMSRSGTVVALLSWLLHVGEEPPTSDLLVVTGVTKGQVSLFHKIL